MLNEKTIGIVLLIIVLAIGGGLGLFFGNRGKKSDTKG